MKITLARTLVGAATISLALASCSSDGGSSTASPSNTDVKLYAAASLSKVMPEIIDAYQTEHPGTTVTAQYAGSADLLSQLSAGAKGDLLITADEASMTKATDAKLTTGAASIIAKNSLAIIAPAKNPAKITGINSLGASGLKLVLCAEQVPCGKAANESLAKAKVKVKPVSLENKVTDVLGKVTSGEAGAGIVYVSDAKGAGDQVTTIAVPAADQVITSYPASVLASGSSSSAAASLIEFLKGATAQGILKTAGFAAP